MRVLVITGPTAVGKTRVATALASLADIEIVSADSRQIYRGLDIGTAKPTAEERTGRPYHGLDLVEPSGRYSAGRFAADAAAWIQGIASRGRLPVVVGGTGLYLRALFEGLFEEPPLDETRRDVLRLALSRVGTPELIRWAGRLDAAIKGRDRQRAMRALEVALLTGTPLSAWQRRSTSSRRNLSPWYALLELDRRVLAERISARTSAMLADGLVEEVKELLEHGVPAGAPAMSGVGYREAVEYLAGRLAHDALPAAIAQATRRYAKRQETWFRHQLPEPVSVFDASVEPGALARQVLARYRAAAS